MDHNDRAWINELVHAAAPQRANREAERRILACVAGAWNRGWQPVELARHARRTTNAHAARLALVAIAADHVRRASSTLDPRWAAQLVELQLPHVASNDTWIDTWAESRRLERREQVGAIVALLSCLDELYGIPILIPPPGASAREPVPDLTAKTNDPMLNRVRALLAQAESTQFEAEADAFTAKAQELMTRHAIDMAMVAAGNRRSEHPVSIRIPIDEPYVSAKSQLLHVVAKHSRCKAVFHRGFAMSSIVGFASDLDAAETLYTSLLVQAQVAMQATASATPPGHHARSRGFRSAFIAAYAHRVGERLAEINRDVAASAETESGRSVLPVLAARSQVVEAALGEMFGRLGRARTSRSVDAAGWTGGRRAADRARLTSGERGRAAPALPASDVPRRVG